jgi:hypothetical protein
MGKQHLSRDDRIFMDGKRRGTQENMDMVAMVLIDKCGWHVYNNRYGTRGRRIGESQINHPAFSKKVLCVETGEVFVSMHEAARRTGINRANIGSACLGRPKHGTAGGYHWKYVGGMT